MILDRKIYSKYIQTKCAQLKIKVEKLYWRKVRKYSKLKLENKLWYTRLFWNLFGSIEYNYEIQQYIIRTLKSYKDFNQKLFVTYVISHCISLTT